MRYGSARHLDLESLQAALDQISGPDAVRLARLCERRYEYERTRPQRDRAACKEWFALAAGLWRRAGK